MQLRFRPPRKPRGIGRLDPKTDKREFIWWPDNNALDRQKIEIGVPFERKGERLLVEKTKGGGLKSTYLGPAHRKEK